MQFIILYIGILVFMFYQFNQPPLIHNKALWERALRSEQSAAIQNLDSEYKTLFDEKRQQSVALADALRADDQQKIDVTRNRIEALNIQQDTLRTRAKAHIFKATGEKGNDTDFVFINFVISWLPHGLIGLLLAVVFSAAMSSTASELNALTSTTTVDIYKRSIVKNADDKHYVTASKWITAGWAVFAMGFAMLASHAENLIQLVNIVGSLFYGTLLGIFLTAFYIKYVSSTAVFISALIGEAIVIYLWAGTNLAFLFYNLAGCAAVIGFAIIIQFIMNRIGRPGS
jgi:Na+(H+)/acetate symporter ActP